MKRIVFKYLKLKIQKDNISLKVKGISMLPTICENDIVTIKYKSTIREGDIIAFFYKDELLVHRVIKVYEQIYWCKGDNTVMIEKVDKKDLLGIIDSVRKSL